jgi:hypothetical protein
MLGLPEQACVYRTTLSAKMQFPRTPHSFSLPRYFLA